MITFIVLVCLWIISPVIVLLLSGHEGGLNHENKCGISHIAMPFSYPYPEIRVHYW